MLESSNSSVTADSQIAPNANNESTPAERDIMEEAATDNAAGSAWASLRVYAFTLGELNFIVTQGLYCELLTQTPEPMPNSPTHFCGLVAVRGDLVPVYDLHPLLGIDSNMQRDILLVGQPPNAAAIYIDAKPKTLNFGSMIESEQVPCSNYLSDLLVANYGLQDDRSVVYSELDFPSLFKQLATQN